MKYKTHVQAAVGQTTKSAVRTSARRSTAKAAVKAAGEQEFAFRAPAALSVQLVGDFTRWQDRPVSLHRDGDGIWRAKVKLEPGVHHYRFLVDGEWRDDPECKFRVPNSFGTENMVCEVR